MADPRFRAQVELERRGGMPEDVSVNVMHFEGDDDPGQPDRARWDQLAPGLANRIAGFYQDVGAYLAATLTGNGVVTLYDMADATPRIPRFIEPFTFVPSGVALPAEVALVISFKAEALAGANTARRRGRIFLGPIADFVPFDPALSDIRPGPLDLQAILGFFGTMARGTAGSARLAIFSPTTLQAGGTIDDAWTDADSLWMDDAFDTQRRRGAAATLRVTEAL